MCDCSVFTLTPSMSGLYGIYGYRLRRLSHLSRFSFHPSSARLIPQSSPVLHESAVTHQSLIGVCMNPTVFKLLHRQSTEMPFIKGSCGTRAPDICCRFALQQTGRGMRRSPMGSTQ